jgi:mycothiol synthase
MTPDHVRTVAEAAAEADGAAPLDEAALMALADGTVTGTADRHGFALLLGDELALVVHPDHRGHGHAGRLLSELAAAGQHPRTAWSHGNHPAAAALARAHGWERVRDLWVMRRPAALDLAEPRAVDGVTIRGYVDDDAAEVVRVNAAAFATHPEQGAMDLANLRRRMSEPWWDPAGLLVADAGDGLLGFHWTKVHLRTDAERAAGLAPLGEVYVVGVDPRAQGRGLGKALTLAGLHHLHGVGVREVLLYVESDNTPAVATYSGLGFTHRDSDTHVMYAAP